MVLCGLGGVFVEVLKDVSSGLVPFLATPKAVVAVDAAYPNRKIGPVSYTHLTLPTIYSV